MIIAALIAVIVRPVIEWLYRESCLPRGVAIAVTYLSLVILIPLAVVLVVPVIANALQYVVSLDYQIILQRGTTWLGGVLTGLQAVQLPVPALDAYVEQTADTLLAALQDATPTEVPTTPVATILPSLGAALTTTFGSAASLIGGVFTSVLLFIFIFLASIYISLNAHTYPDAFLRLVSDAYKVKMAVLLARIIRLWNAFFRGRTCSELPSPLPRVDKFCTRERNYTKGEFDSCSTMSPLMSTIIRSAKIYKMAKRYK